MKLMGGGTATTAPLAVLALMAVAVLAVAAPHAAGAPIVEAPGEQVKAPTPDAQGNYRAVRRRLLHPRWQVVDPEGLNCRMPEEFQWRDLGERISDTPESSNIVDSLWAEQPRNPLHWPVMQVLPPGSVVRAWGGNLGAMIVLDDHRNLPWLPVWVQHADRQGHCFVRANQRFIRPVDSPAAD